MVHRTMTFFEAATAGQGETSPPTDFLLVQHILELFLGIPFEAYEFESISFPLLPPDNTKSDNNRWSGTGGLHMETQACPKRKLDGTLDLTTVKRQIPHGSMT